MNWLVIGVDPGPVPGIVVLLGGSGALTTRIIQCDRDSALPIVQMYLDQDAGYKRQILALEKFVVGPRAARSSTPKAGADARRVICELGSEAAYRSVEFVERPAGSVKPWATDVRLERAGLLAATKGMTHARDAARHALYAAVHAGLMSDPLSSKVRGA